MDMHIPLAARDPHHPSRIARPLFPGESLPHLPDLVERADVDRDVGAARARGHEGLGLRDCLGGALIPLCSNEANLKNRWATDSSYGVLWTKLPL